MRLTARQLNRATLDRQLLLGRRKLSVIDAVRRICALQAQSPASPYLALWNRISDSTSAIIVVRSACRPPLIRRYATTASR